MSTEGEAEHETLMSTQGMGGRGDLDAEVVLAVLAEGDADGMVDHVGGAVEDDLGEGFDPLHGAPAADGVVHVGLVDLAGAEGEHQEVFHAADGGEFALVVQDVRYGDGGGVVHDDAAVDGSAGGFRVDGRDARGREEGGSGGGGAADLPQVEVPCLALERVRAREQEGGSAGEVVAGDEHGLDGVAERERVAVLPHQVLLQDLLEWLR